MTTKEIENKEQEIIFCDTYEKLARRIALGNDYDHYAADEEFYEELDKICVKNLERLYEHETDDNCRVEYGGIWFEWEEGLGGYGWPYCCPSGFVTFIEVEGVDDPKLADSLRMAAWLIGGWKYRDFKVKYEDFDGETLVTISAAEVEDDD